MDASGNVVNYETIKAGEPTTVYYTTVDGQPVVSKVVVQPHCSGDREQDRDDRNHHDLLEALTPLA